MSERFNVLMCKFYICAVVGVIIDSYVCVRLFICLSPRRFLSIFIGFQPFVYALSYTCLLLF